MDNVNDHQNSSKEIIICQRCGTSLSTKGNYLAHLQIKNECPPNISNTSREQLIIGLQRTFIRERTECEICQKEITKCNYKRHVETCKLKQTQNTSTDVDQILSNDDIIASLQEQNMIMKNQLQDKDKIIEELRDVIKNNNNSIKLVINVSTDKGADKYKKSKISQAIRIKCWNTHIGEEIPFTMCLCCKEVKITQHNFHCGHIVAERRGGTKEIVNLKPICAVCNNSMGQMNMDDFKTLYGFA
jgi:hypothetical protein